MTHDTCGSDKGLFSVSLNIYASLLLSVSVGGRGVPLNWHMEEFGLIRSYEGWRGEF